MSEIYLDRLVVSKTIPDELWVNRLRRGNYVWLAKESRFATIEWEFEPPEPGHIAGRIALRKVGAIDNGVEIVGWSGNIESWFIRANGQGMDHSQLFLPVEGHLSDNPPEIDEPVVRNLKRELAKLQSRVDLLERTVWLSNALTGQANPYRYPVRKR